MLTARLAQSVEHETLKGLCCGILSLGDLDGSCIRVGLFSEARRHCLFTSVGFVSFFCYSPFLFLVCFWVFMSWFLVVFDLGYLLLEMGLHCPPSAAASRSHASALSPGSSVALSHGAFLSVSPSSCPIRARLSTPLLPASASAAPTTALLQMQTSSYFLGAAAWLPGALRPCTCCMEAVLARHISCSYTLVAVTRCMGDT